MEKRNYIYIQQHEKKPPLEEGFDFDDEK